MDIDSVQTLYFSSAVARKFFDHMARRKRNQKETLVNRIFELLRYEGEEVDKKDLNDLFKELGQLGLGQYVVGRKGYQTRIVWAVGSLWLAKIATGEIPADSISDGELNESDELDEPEELTHSYILRESLTVSLVLPSDLTKAEADRLAMFIRSLPFEE